MIFVAKRLLSKNNKSIGKAILLVIIINMILALTVMVKEIFSALYLGTSSHADALILAFFIPDTFTNTVLGASIGTACIPVFSKLYSLKKFDRLKRSIYHTSALFLGISLLLFLIFLFTKAPIVQIIGRGFSPDVIALCLNLFIIVLPTVLIFPFISILTSVKQVQGQFFAPSFAPVIFNLFFIGSLAYTYLFQIPVSKGVYYIAFAILSGILVEGLFIWTSVRLKTKDVKLQSKKLPMLKLLNEDVSDIKDVLRVFAPYFLILLVSQIVFFFERYLASHLGTGTISALNYAFRLSQFPLWVFIASINAVVFPSMSKAFGQDNIEELKDTFTSAFKAIIVILVPIVILFFTLRAPIISLLLQRGAFNTESLNLTEGILKGYVFTILGQGITTICLRVSMSLRKMKIPLMIFIVSISINIFLDFYLVEFFKYEVFGYAAAVGSTINAVLITLFVCHALQIQAFKKIRNLIKILALNIPIGLIATFSNILWVRYLYHDSFIGKFEFVFIVSLTCIIVYGSLLKVYKIY